MSDKRYIIELRSEGKNPTPIEVRLRQALKLLLRAFGLRCVSISEVKADDAREDAK